MGTSGTGATVGTHWAHLRFVQNLVNASRARELNEAAREWKLEKLGAFQARHNCQLCNTGINRYVLLHNQVNDNRLIVGADCYDKFLQFLREGKVESALPPRTAHANVLRSYWNSLLRKLQDHTVLGWLKNELSAGTLPNDVANIVYAITRLGFAPTTGDADQVVAYYKANRKFELRALLRHDELAILPCSRFIPFLITIDDLKRVRRILEKRAMAIERRRQAEILRRREAELTARQQHMWMLERLSILDILSVSDRKISQFERDGIPIGIARREFGELQAKIAVLLPETLPSFDEFHERPKAARDLVSKWAKRSKWWLCRPEKVLFINDEGELFIHVNRRGVWIEQDYFRLTVVKGLNPETGIYSARVIEVGRYMEVLLTAKHDPTDQLVEVDFCVPSMKRRGTLVGTYKGKVVLPDEPVWERGKYQVFLTGDTGRYYRAILI